MLLNRNNTVALKKLIASFQDFENKIKLYHVGALKKYGTSTMSTHLTIKNTDVQRKKKPFFFLFLKLKK